MHIECLTIENVYAAIYKGSKGKIQHFNAFAFLLSPWNSILSWHYQSIKQEDWKVPLPRISHIWLQSCSPDMWFCNLSSGQKIWSTSAPSSCLQALATGSFNKGTHSSFQRIPSLPYFLVSASFIRLSWEFLMWKSKE